jgi:hypothetical protein
MKSARYSGDYPKRMYIFFKSYSDLSGAPSFVKFAESIGVTLADLERFRAHYEFDRSYRECSEIRRDYLIDNALTRRFDPSLVKYLLDNDRESDAADDSLTVRVEVVE